MTKGPVGPVPFTEVVPVRSLATGQAAYRGTCPVHGVWMLASERSARAFMAEHLGHVAPSPPPAFKPKRRSR